ncbi:MAG TPA: DUF1287 domain-containing protein [Polyangiaceae bacterium]
MATNTHTSASTNVSTTAIATATTVSASASATSPPVVARAREEVARAVSYDPSWYSIRYPNGDVDASIGVCTDVVIRGYRAINVDFQKLVHEDVVRNPAAYEPYVKTPDATIDHRRVGPLLTYLRRHAHSLDKNGDYQAGDIVVISFNACPSCSPQHVGVVSDRKGPRGIPLLIHNMGPTPREDDTLDAWTHLGHFRL